MIVSYINGRVRLRSPALCSEKTLEEIRGMLATYAGVEKMETNARTGSLLVFYDSAMISKEHLDMAVAMLENLCQTPVSCPDRDRSMRKGPGLRRIENRLLLGSAFMTLAGSVSGMKPLHIVGGTLFFLLSARHLHMRRKVF